MHAQLVLAPGHRCQRIPPGRIAALQHLDARLAVGCAVLPGGRFAHAEKRLARHHRAAPHQHRFALQPGQRGRQRFVALGDLPQPEQILVRRARGRIGRKQHQPGGIAVDAVQRHQVRVAQTTHQPRQQRLAHEAPGRHHRQEMRFVGDHQMVIGEQHRLHKRDHRLIHHLAEIADLGTNAEGRIDRQRLACRVEHPPATKPVDPDLARHRREARAQAIEHGRPRPRRQLHAAGGAALGQRLGGWMGKSFHRARFES